MTISTKLAQRLNRFLGNINEIIDELIRRGLSKNNGISFEANLNFPALNSESSSKFDLKSIFEKGIVWCPVPKKRTTAESKLTKKFLPFANNFITKYSRPKTNIIVCLDCGSYHEKGTICGKCYQQVKAETEEIQKHLFKDDSFKYSYPQKEIAILYEGEDRKYYLKNNKQIVEIPKKRPSWFSNKLMTKISTK